MVEIKNLHMFVPGRQILKGVNLSVPKGKITTIMGPNGCGKSTVVKSIAGLAKYQIGSIEVDGLNRKEYKKKDFAKKVSFLMQFCTVMTGISVEDIITYGRMPYKERFKSLKKEDYEKIKWAMEVTDTVKFKDRDIMTLSGGEKQRVWIAMCLAQEPELLVLDEPTNHLDLKYQFSLLSLVKDLNEKYGITVLFVLHDINQASRFSDHMIIMKDGEVITSGTPKQCITKDVMHKVYEVETEVEVNDYVHIKIK